MSGSVVTIYGAGGEALTQRSAGERVPPGWRALKIPSYKGNTNPEDHLRSFRMNMEDRTGRKDIWCQMFHKTLTGEAITWYRMLPTGSVHTYKDLERSFKAEFSYRQRRPKHRATLAVTKQGDFESTRDYMDRFAQEVQKVEGIKEETILLVLSIGLRHTFCKRPREEIPDHIHGGYGKISSGV